MVKRNYVPSSKDTGVDRHLMNFNGVFSVTMTKYLKRDTYKEKKCLFNSTVLGAWKSKINCPPLVQPQERVLDAWLHPFLADGLASWWERTRKGAEARGIHRGLALLFYSGVLLRKLERSHDKYTDPSNGNTSSDLIRKATPVKCSPTY